MTCPLFVAVKAACRSVWRSVVCQGVQTASTDIFFKNSGAEAVNGDRSECSYSCEKLTD